jgi:hypothetical protein
MASKAKHGLTEWAQQHPDLVEYQMELAREHGWNVQYATAVLLAAVDWARAELAVEGDGAAPTLRGVFYRIIARARYEKSDSTYDALVYAARRARVVAKIWPRDAFADGGLPHMYVPSRDAVDEELQAAIAELSQPADPFTGTGIVVAVVCEAAGMEQGLAGAIRKRLGFDVQVWPAGGQPSIPFGFMAGQTMSWWAGDNDDAEQHLLVISDFDASGLVIANVLEGRGDVPDCRLHRIGVTPKLAERFGAPTAEGLTLTKAKPDNTHEATELWRQAVAEYGDVKVQAEALGVAAWAEVVEEWIDGLLDRVSGSTENGGPSSCTEIRSALDERQAEFRQGDAGALRAKIIEASKEGREP